MAWRLSGGADDDRPLYVYNYHYTQNQQQRLQNAWGKWTMPANANILDIGISDGELSVITQNSDGLYLNSLGLDLLGSALLAGDPAFVPGPLAQLTVAPNPITLGHSVAQTFTAVGQGRTRQHGYRGSGVVGLWRWHDQ